VSSSAALQAADSTSARSSKPRSFNEAAAQRPQLPATPSCWRPGVTTGPPRYRSASVQIAGPEHEQSAGGNFSR
jgi:hypothetical protein